VRVLLAGDSIATTLAQGLYPFEQHYGFALHDASIIHCGFVRGEVWLQDRFEAPGQDCLQSRDRWRAEVERLRPDVVLLLPGLWDGRDHRVNGVELAFGTAAARPHWLSELRSLVDLFGSRGAHVVLLTTPLFPPGHHASISDQRVAELEALVRRVAGERPGAVSVMDLNQFLYPAGSFQDFIDGINVRGDGFHFSLEGAVMVGEWLTPQVSALGD
jgi:hypothetical protein